MIRRLLSVFLSAQLLFSAAPMTANAVQSGQSPRYGVRPYQYIVDPAPTDGTETPGTEPTATPADSPAPDADPTATPTPAATDGCTPTPSAEDAQATPTAEPTATPEPQETPAAALLSLETTGTLEMVSTLGEGNEHDIALSDSCSYNLTMDITAESLAVPKLVVTVPKNIAVSYYPTASNTTLAGSLASVANPVTYATDSEGRTVLTYYFKANVTTVGFNITLAPSYKLKTGSSYRVDAALYDDTAEQAAVSDTVTVTSNPTLAPGVYYFSYQVENVILKDNAEYYYAKMNGYAYTPYNTRYDYDSLEIIVPLPAGAEPGYYESGEFVPLAEGTERSFANGTATYHSSYSFVNSSGSAVASGRAVVYRLSPPHQLVSGGCYNYHYFYNDNMGALYLRFPGTTAEGDYLAPCSAAARAYVDGDGEHPVWLADYGAGSTTVYCRFKQYKIEDYFNQRIWYGSNNVYTANNVLNLEDCAYFYSYYLNNTGETIRDIEAEYNIPQELNCYKLTFSLSADAGSGYPGSVAVEYRTRNDTELRTVTKTADDTTLALSDPTDAITYAHLVFDQMSSAEYNRALVYGYVINSGDVDGATPLQVRGQILSATPTGSIGDIEIGAQTEQSVYMNLKKSYTIRPGGNLVLSPASLSKGDTFQVRFILSDNQAYLTDPCVYVLMPSEFIFSRYQSPYSDGQYGISQRDITVAAETATASVPAGSYTLYTIRYTGGRTYNTYSWHYMYFTVGPEVDTATLRTGVYLPAAIAATHGNGYFPYDLSNASYRMPDTWDFDGDGDTGEYLPTMSAHPTATINAVRTISAQSYLTSSHTGSGENLTQSYRYNSTGLYKLYINNGLESGNTAKNAAVTVHIPKTAYPAGGYTSAWNAELTGPPTLNGSFLTGAGVLYSADGGSTYSAEAGDYGDVTDVKIVTAEGVPLENSQSASIVLPFAADFPTGVNGAVNAYFKADFSYYLNDSATPSATDIPVNTLTAAPAPVSGFVFKDYDGNGTQDPSERNNSQCYSVYLYGGGYTSGTDGLAYIASASTAYDTGAYSFSQIWLPGTYTIRVTKASGECFPQEGAFVQDGGGDDAYYTFTLDDETAAVDNANLGIVAPRTLTVNAGSFFVYYQGASRKVVPAVYPELTGSESVSYASSDEGVVTVSADGTLNYTGDGNATVTVSVPQLAALTGTFGEDPVTRTVAVYARHASYAVTYRDHEGTDITASLPEAYAGCLSYAPNTNTPLPSAAPYGRTGYTFAGWWDAGTGGNRAYYIYSSEYGDKEFHARWTPQAYGIAYAGMAGASYGTNHPNWHTYGTATDISDPSKAGYVFAGWTINGGAQAYTGLTLGAEDYTAGITLTATWTLAEPTVSLSTDAVGGTVTYGTDITITADAWHALGASCCSYAWRKAVPGGTDESVGTNSRTLTLRDVADSGVYYCAVTASDGALSAQKQSDPIEVTIDRADGAVTGLTDIGKTYDGSPVAPPEYSRTGSGTVTVEYKAKADADTLYGTAAPADAGEYTVRVTAAADANHNAAEATRDFTIDRRAVTVTPAGGASKTYGEEDPALGYTTDAASSVVSGQTLVLGGAPGREAGENAGSYAIGLGTLELGDGDGSNAFRAANYRLALSAEPVYFVIGCAEMGISVSGFTGPYDGEGHGILVTAPEGSTVTYRTEGGEWTAVNPMFTRAAPAETVYYRVVKANYLTVEGSETVTVEKRPLTVTAGSAERMYDGTALEAGGYSVTAGSFAPGEGFESVTVEGSQTLVGEAQNTITAYLLREGTDEANYTITAQPGTLKVRQAAIGIEITAGSAARTYDGTALTEGGWKLTGGTLAAGDAIESVEVAGSVTDAGTAGNSVVRVVIKHGDADVTANYRIAKVNGTLAVGKRPIELTAGSAEKVYDGVALTNSGWSLTGGSLAPGDAIGSVAVTGHATDAGTAGNAVGSVTIVRGDADVTANYSIARVSGTLTVSKRSVEATADSAGKLYDGTALAAGGYSVREGGFAPGEGFESVKVEGSCLFPGTAAARITGYALKGNTKAQNYDITLLPGTLTVRKAAIPLKIIASDRTQAYTGKPVTSNDCTVRGTFAEGDRLSVVITGSVTDAGTAANTVAEAKILHDGVDVSENYAVTKEPGTLTVEPRAYSADGFGIAGVEARYGFTGEAVEPGPAITAGGAALVPGRDYTLSYADNTYPGAASVTVRFTGNYSGSVSVPFEISEPAVTTVVPGGITANAATLKGAVSAAGGETGFYYKTADAAEYARIGAGAAGTGFESALTGLTPGTVYVYHAFMKTGGKEYAGREVRFQTAPEAAPQDTAPTGRVDVSINNGTGSAFEGTLSIEKGNTVVSTAAVSVEIGRPFSHSFAELADGQYNIVLHVGQFTETNKVRILNGVTEKTEFRVESLAMNSVVEVRGTAPQVAVGGISEVYGAAVDDPAKGVTQQELDTGRDIEIRVVVDEVSAVDEAKAAEMGMIEDISDGNVGLFIDFSVIKTVTYAEGSTETRLTEVPGMLSIAIPIPDELKGRNGYVIYRVHNGAAEAITERPNAEGEFIEVTGDGYILLHVKKFSTYAIGYSGAQAPAARALSRWWLLLIALCLALATAAAWRLRSRRRPAPPIQ